MSGLHHLGREDVPDFDDPVYQGSAGAMRPYVKAHGRAESRPGSRPLAARLRGHDRRFEARRLVRGRAHRRQPLIPRRRAEASLGGMPRPDDSQPHLAAIARAAAETRWRNSVIVALEAVEQGQFIDPGDAVRPGRPSRRQTRYHTPALRTSPRGSHDVPGSSSPVAAAPVSCRAASKLRE